MTEKPIAHCTLEQLAFLVHVIPGEDRIPLYTAPPKREWVGLTEAELQFQLAKHRKLVNAHYDRAENTNIITETFDGTSFYNEVVAILKEKNT